MKRVSSLNIKKAKTSIKLLKVIQSTPKKDDHFKKENSLKKAKEIKDMIMPKIIPNNLNDKLLKQHSKFYDKNNFISSPKRPKDIINRLITKTIDQNKFIQIIKYVNSKLYENYGYPYIDIKYILKEDETFPIYYDYYKINKILKDVKCRLVSKFHDYNLELNDNEYLIRYSPRKDYYILMKYLLFFVYGYDRLTYSKKCQKFYDLQEVKFAFKSLFLFNKTENTSSEENSIEINNNRNINNNKKKVYSKFRSSLNMKQVSKYDNYNNSSSKNYKIYKKRYSVDIDHNIINNNKLNIINSNNKSNSNTNIIEIKKNLNVEKKKNKKNKNKLNDEDEYFEGLGGIINNNLISCKCKKPVYLFISSIPFKLVPNCLPNLYPVMKHTLNIFNDYYINIGKLKLNIYPNNNKKSIKKYRWYTDEKYYNEFIKTISFSTEEYKFKDKGKEIKKLNLCHNPNRRLKIDNDIIDVEKLIDAIEEMPKQVDINIIDKSKTSRDNSDSKSSNEEIESSLNNKEEKNKSSNSKNQINDKDHNKRKSSILSFKSNNFHSSITSNENIESNKDKNNRSINNNTIKENPKTNEEKKIENDLTNKSSEKSIKNKVYNKTVKSLKSIPSKDYKDNYFLNNNQLKKTNNNSIERYNKDNNNKRNINIFKNNNSKNNKKLFLSTNKNKNKIRLMKKNYDYYSNKETEIIPYITEKNNKISSKPLTIKEKMKNSNSLNFDSRPHSGKYNFKHTYEFAFGKYEEKNKIKYKMNLIKEITTEFQKNLFFSKPKNKFQNKEFFPSIDFLISCRMKNKKRIEERKNEDVNYKDKYEKYQSLTIQTMNNSRKKEIKRNTKKNNTLN